MKTTVNSLNRIFKLLLFRVLLFCFAFLTFLFTNAVSGQKVFADYFSLEQYAASGASFNDGDDYYIDINTNGESYVEFESHWRDSVTLGKQVLIVNVYNASGTKVCGEYTSYNNYQYLNQWLKITFKTSGSSCTFDNSSDNNKMTIPYSLIQHGGKITIKGQLLVSNETVNVEVYDRAAPSSPSVTNSCSSTWCTSASIGASGTSDKFAGFDEYYYSTNNSSWSRWPYGTYKSGNSWTYSWTTEMDGYLYIRACDNAGNCTSSKSTRVRIDRTAPSSSLSVSNSSSGNWTDQNVTLTLTGGADTGTYKSGFSKYQYSYDKSSWYNDWSSTGTTTTGVWSAERNNTVYFRVCDVAGNCSSESSTTTTIRIDKTLPVLTIGTPTSGTIVGSGTSTAYHAQPSKSVTITFTDNLYLYKYDSTAYYRYSWCTSSSSCNLSYSSVGTSRTTTQVTGTITTPSTQGVHYLWIEGDVRDGVSTHYMSNSTNVGAVATTSSNARVFKFNIDNTAMSVSASVGNTSSHTYIKNGQVLTFTISDSTYGFNTSGSYLSVTLWDGNDPIQQGYLTLSKTSSGITSLTYTMTINTTSTRELKVRIDNLTDYAGKTGSTYVFLYYIDNTPPVVSIYPYYGTSTGSGTSTTYIETISSYVEVMFTDNYYLYNYSSTSYYRYRWCTSSSSCSESYTSVGTSRTSTSVSGEIPTPSTGGTWYLWIEGSARDAAGNYVSNSTNVGGIGSTSSTDRKFKFTIDDQAPVLTIGTPSSGSVIGSGTSTIYYSRAGSSVTVTFTDNAYLSMYSSTSWYRYKWCTSSSSCDSSSYTSVGSSRTATKVTGTITAPSTQGVHYLWIEGDVTDYFGLYLSNDTNVNGVGINSSDARVFKFIVDTTAPTLTVSGQRTLVGSGTSSVHYARASDNITITYTDNYGLYMYSSTSYYRYMWCTSSSSCSTGYSSIGSSRTETKVTGTIPTPSTEGTYYLWLEGDVKDYVSYYPSNSRTVDGIGTGTSGTRIFKFVVDNTPPTLTIGTPTNGTIDGSGTGTIYYAQSGVSVSVTFTDNVYLQNYSSTSYYRYFWCTSNDINECSDDGIWYESIGTSRTTTQVTGTITTPSTAGDWYLFIEGDPRDYSNFYLSNSRNMYGIGSSSSTERIFKFIIDNTRPVFTDNLMTFDEYSMGNDGNAYITGNTSIMDIEWYEQYYKSYAITVPSGVTYEMTDGSMYASTTPISTRFEFDLSSLTVNFDTALSITIRLYDKAGNNTAITWTFYKIDNSRDISIDSFKIHSYNALYYNWIGTSSTNSGKIAPVFTLSNTTYRDTSFFIFTVGDPLDENMAYLKNAFVYCDGVAISCNYTSYTYAKVDGTYSYGTFTTSQWYNQFGDNDTKRSYLFVRNIYGRMSSATVEVTFDLVNPVISSLIAQSGTDGTNGGKYTVDSYIKLMMYWKDRNNVSLSSNVDVTIDSGNLSGTNAYKYTYLNADTSSFSVDFDNAKQITITITDKAGNSTSRTYYFYKIDGSRDVNVSTFYVMAEGASTRNLIGLQSVTSGMIKPVYTLSNNSWMDKTMMLVFIGRTAETLDGEEQNLFAYCYAGVHDCADVTKVIASGSYLTPNGENAYNTIQGNPTSVSDWYSQFTNGMVKQATIWVANIYGRVTKVSVNVKFDFDAPELDLTYNKTNKTGVVKWIDENGIRYDPDVGGSFEYYMSESSSFDVTQVTFTDWITPIGTFESEDEATIYLSSGQYYLYVRIRSFRYDEAGNTATDEPNDMYNVQYRVYRYYVDIPISNANDASTRLDEDTINSIGQITEAGYEVQVTALDRIVIMTFRTELPSLTFTRASISKLLEDKVGYTIVTVKDKKEFTFTKSEVYHNVLVTDYDSETELIDLIIILAAPSVDDNSAVSHVELDEGDEVGNIAVSFISETPFTVDTQVIYNGELVRAINTSKPGVYEVRNIARDILGNVNRYDQTVVVKERAKVEQVVVNEINDIIASNIIEEIIPEITKDAVKALTILTIVAIETPIIVQPAILSINEVRVLEDKKEEELE